MCDRGRLLAMGLQEAEETLSLTDGPNSSTSVSGAHLASQHATASPIRTDMGP